MISGIVLGALMGGCSGDVNVRGNISFYDDEQEPNVAVGRGDPITVKDYYIYFDNYKEFSFIWSNE